MALNRGLYKSQGTNIVSQGTMSQRWLLNDVATGLGTSNGINTTTDEFGRPGNATVGRGLTASLTGSASGKIVVTLPQGASWANVVKASCDVIKYDPASGHAYLCATNRLIPQSATAGTGVEFVSYLIDNSPNVADPPFSVNNTAPSHTPGTYPNLAASQVVTTVRNVPVTLTSGTIIRTGLTMTLTVSAPGAPVTAGSFVTGTAYTIATIGNTDFTLVGAASNTVGTTFVATGVGVGTGTATTQAVSAGVFDQSDADIRALLSSPTPGAALTYTISVQPNYGVGVGTTANGASVAIAAGSSANIGTLAVTAPNPTYIAVNIEFTESTVPA